MQVQSFHECNSLSRQLPAVVGGVNNTAKAEHQEKQKMLWQLVERCGAHLSPGKRDAFYHLLLTRADTFASSTADLGRTNRLCHQIDTGDSPLFRPICCIAPCRREEVKQLLNQMLEQEVIEPSSSPWASSVVLVQ